QFNDPGVTWMFANLCRLLREKKGGQSHFSANARQEGQGESRESDSDPLSFRLGNERCDFDPKVDTTLKEPRATVLIPGARVRYLAEIAEQGRGVNSSIARQAEAANRAQSFWEALREIGDTKLHRELDLYDADDLVPLSPTSLPQGERGLSIDRS